MSGAFICAIAHVTVLASWRVVAVQEDYGTRRGIYERLHRRVRVPHPRYLTMGTSVDHHWMTSFCDSSGRVRPQLGTGQDANILP